MEQLPTTPPKAPGDAGASNEVGLWFILLGLAALTAALIFGVLGAFKFLYPEFLEALPFYKLRPLHVSLAVAWIFLAAIGGIYYYLPNFCGLRLASIRAARWHFWIFLATGLAILGAYLTGRFGGREYWAYPPALAAPILLTWLMFGINYGGTVFKRRTEWPVYLWMWGTGIVFFLITFSENYLWLLPYFRENMVREITVQWKSFGSMVGSWNMLVYGTAIFVMGKISGDDGVARSKMAFGLYFLGLFNLIFGWAHHVYPVPLAEWVRVLAYAVSMTELFILGKIIWDWRRTLSTRRKFRHRRPYRFLFAADIWIFLNLVLALLISVPAFNLFVHGTHVIVAHTMGATIGINTMILLASVFFVIEQRAGERAANRHAGLVDAGFWLANASLVVFLAALLAAGLVKGASAGEPFSDMMASIEPFLLLFAVSGVGLMLGFWLILLPAMVRIGALVFPCGYDIPTGAARTGQEAAGD